MKSLPCPALVLSFALLCLACAGNLPTTAASKPPIPYTVLADTTAQPIPKPQLAVLVDEKTTRDQAMALAEFLRKKHEGHLSILNIFDSRKAWEGSKDPNYPEKELDRHWLVSWDDLGDGKPRWEAKARDH